MLMFFSFSALFKMRCLFLNLLSLQTMVRGRSRSWPFFYFTSPYSVTSINFYVTLYSQLIRNDILDFFSHASHVSLGSSFIPSIRRLLLQDLSSNSTNFADTSPAVNGSSSMALTSVFKFLISFFYLE